MRKFEAKHPMTIMAFDLAHRRDSCVEGTYEWNDISRCYVLTKIKDLSEQPSEQNPPVRNEASDSK